MRGGVDLLNRFIINWVCSWVKVESDGTPGANKVTWLGSSVLLLRFL